MIIFVEDTNVQELVSLFNGETNSFDLNNKPNTVFNISSLYGLGVKVDLTPPYTANIDDRTFDAIYAQHILGNDGYFKNFFQMIYANYLGFNVFILVGTDSFDGRQKMTESLMKLIQQRYCMIPRYIQTFEDIPNYYEEDKIFVDGMFNMDMDKERYIYLTANVEALRAEIESYDEQVMGKDLLDSSGGLYY